MTPSVGKKPEIFSRIGRGAFMTRLGLTVWGLLLANPAWAISVSIISPSNSVVASPATITLSAAATPGSGRRILRVDFFRGTTRISSDASAPYSTVLNNVTAGTYVFTALAIDSGGSVAVSDPVVVRVDNPPAVAVTSPTANATFAPGTDITVTAAASDSDEVVRKVEFFANGILIGTQVLAPYQINWSNVQSGRYTLTARATDLVGLATTSTPVSVSVEAAPTVVITNPAAGAIFTAPATIAVTALASDSDGTVSRVEFFDGGSLVGTVNPNPGNSRFSATITDLSAGQHTLTARAVDDQGFEATSSPVTITVSAAAQLYYIHTDHLNTPRLIANQQGATVWRLDSTEPFGNSPSNEDPDDDGVPFVFDLRFPGQFFDRETGLLHNINRDYDSGIGRYIQSDPIGLNGGTNTYTYAHSNSLLYVDPDGKASTIVMCVAAGLIAYGGYTLWSKYSCQNDCELDCARQHMCPTGCPYSEGDTGPLAACKRVCFAKCWLGMGKKGPMGPTPNSPPNNPSPAPAGPR